MSAETKSQGMLVQTRRDALKTSAIAAATGVAGLSAPVDATAQTGADGIRWDKGVCRFCGTGCGVIVGTKNGRVVATQGDPDAPVNRGLNCIKGYFLSKIMYGQDRLTQPLLRKKNGKYDKNGDFTPVSWDEAFTIMAEKFKAALKASGPTAVGMFGSGQWTIWEGYAASKLFKGGFRTNNLDPNARHCMASAVAGFIRTFGIDEPMGCYDDLELADAFVLWGSNMAEMHPILWSRLTDRRLTHPGCEVHVLSTFEHRSFELADNPLIFTPQSDLAILNYIQNYIVNSGAMNKEFVEKHVEFARTVEDIGYGLRPTNALEIKAVNASHKAGKDGAKDPGGMQDKIGFEEYNMSFPAACCRRAPFSKSSARATISRCSASAPSDATMRRPSRNGASGSAPPGPISHDRVSTKNSGGSGSTTCRIARLDSAPARSMCATLFLRGDDRPPASSASQG